MNLRDQPVIRIESLAAGYAASRHRNVVTPPAGGDRRPGVEADLGRGRRQISVSGASKLPELR
jgi:hypothetical protein